MNSWARKFKRVIPVVLSILVLLSMAACALKEQESGHSREDNGSSLESSGQYAGYTGDGFKRPAPESYFKGTAG